jgi:hypothetical protein
MQWLVDPELAPLWGAYVAEALWAVLANAGST